MAPLPVVPASPRSRLPPPVSPAAAPAPQPESAPWDSWCAPGRPPLPPSGPQPWPTLPGSGSRPSPTARAARPTAPALFRSPPPPGGGQPRPGGPEATRVDGLGPVPSGDLPTAILGDLRPAPPSGGPRRSRRPLVPVIVAAALVAVVAAVVVFRARSDSTTASGTTGTKPPASSQAARQAAVRLSGLLATSVTDRAAVIDAVADVRGCGPSLDQDARTLASAASSRERLLSRLGSLPGRSLLPAAMLQDLTGAWQASAQADADLAHWADDEISRGRHRDSRSDARLRASYVPDGQATAGKQAFASLWNPVARRYGLAAYQWNQL